ncbi:hypothetical protein ZIOFF_033237 [Zingiber officinale]|uniref:ATPase AAA-type core domain-containing protein n=1 Tax=Zingiber officinale TaxID=94328 RepID=A0A8J5GI12_ZINOF|nr:hypothetical protein ZIOFF_033237 [Zingiber officinale]
MDEIILSDDVDNLEDLEEYEEDDHQTKVKGKRPISDSSNHPTVKGASSSALVKRMQFSAQTGLVNEEEINLDDKTEEENIDGYKSSLGKTTLANIAAKHCGYRAVEINASDDRSASTVESKILDVIQMNSVMPDAKPKCLIIDEIDGALGEGKGVVDVILKMIAAEKKLSSDKENSTHQAEPGKTMSKKRHKSAILNRPVICICNDVYAPALRALRQVAKVHTFVQPTINRVVNSLGHFSKFKSSLMAGLTLYVQEKDSGLIKVHFLHLLNILRKRSQGDSTACGGGLVGDVHCATVCKEKMGCACLFSGAHLATPRRKVQPGELVEPGHLKRAPCESFIPKDETSLGSLPRNYLSIEISLTDCRSPPPLHVIMSSTNQPTQQTAPGGYDYYNQQSQQQQQTIGGSSTDGGAGYNYGWPLPSYNNQVSYGVAAYHQTSAGQQSYGQDGYSTGYNSPAYSYTASNLQSGLDQQAYGLTVSYGTMAISSQDGSASAYGAQGVNSITCSSTTSIESTTK